MPAQVAATARASFGPAGSGKPGWPGKPIDWARSLGPTNSRSSSVSASTASRSVSASMCSNWTIVKTNSLASWIRSTGDAFWAHSIHRLGA